ncbi:protein sensitivity to red light reduced 1 [Quercus suber]|uniref:Protein sensitivity to red light reduced 1 n=1 Tax=Quercus suber TaxID=58331 RepID=A0AAW0JXT4_QUESU
MSVEESMLFRNMEASDFPPCRVRYFNLKLDIVAILASQEAKKFQSLTCETQIGDISTEDEASRLLAEMHNTMKEVAESEFYSKMTDQLRNDPDIQSNLKRVLGSRSHVLMVIYALGSIEYSYRSQYQLAIALLLKNDFSTWIGEIEVFDPMFSPCDCLVMDELGCKVLSVNEQCRREVKKPTLFYTPYAERCHISNVLDANWCPSQINTMILLCVCPGQHHFDFIKKPIFKMFMFVYDEGQFSKEIRRKQGIMKNKFLKKQGDYIHLRNCGEFFFSETFLWNDDFEECRDIDYRIPRRHRCLWQPPHTGWIKLNFSGKGHDKNSPAGFGGIFRNKFEDRMVVYSGNLGEADTTVASVEGLKQGLRCLQYMPPVRRLVVEGNDPSVTRWVSKNGIEPPMKIREDLLEIFDLFRNMDIVVYDVYEEANSLAIELANRGSKLHNLRIWVAPS